MTFALLSPMLRGILLLLHTAGVILTLYLVLRYLQLGRNRRLVLSLALYLALHLFVLALLTQAHTKDVPALVSLPLWLHLLIPVSDLLFGCVQFYLILRWREACITTDSVLESFDALNEGICFYDTSGMTKLVNPRIDRKSVV